MQVKFATNLYDSTGYCYDDCVLLFVGGKEEVVLKFENLRELKEFAENISNQIIPEIVDHNFDELSEEDQAEFGD